jgi:hypothetical protein
VRAIQRRPEGWLGDLGARAVAVCDELGLPDRHRQVEEIGAAAGPPRTPVRGADRLLAPV